MAVRDRLAALARRFNVDRGRWIYDEPPPRWPGIAALLTTPDSFLASTEAMMTRYKRRPYSLLDPNFSDPERARRLRRGATRLGWLGMVSVGVLGFVAVVLVVGVIAKLA
jgi:hypothetical protein